MFPSQMVRLKIVKPSSCPLFCMFPSQMVRLKIVEPSSIKSLSMFPSQMVRLKIVEQSCSPLFACFPCKWYALKLSKSQVAHFINVSLANGTPWNCRKLKWPTFCMFPSQMVHVSLKWQIFPYALKLSNDQVAHFFNVSLANGMP